jgi:hypothetical protein
MMKFKAILLATAMMFASPLAQADDHTGFYAGVSGVVSSVSDFEFDTIIAKKHKGRKAIFYW